VRSLRLSKSGINKFRSHQLELKVADFEESIKPFPPGEWAYMQIAPGETWVGFVNPLIEDKYTCAQLVAKIPSQVQNYFSVEDFIKNRILDAHHKRKRFVGYAKNARLFYGVSDGLPGLIIDQFENAAIIQINTAGVDRFRDLIQKTVSDLMGTPAYFLDNPKYREKESLPIFDNTQLPDLTVNENGLLYKIRSEVLQKVGFYYDHRENRLQLMNFLSRLTVKPESGLDLFSYAGAWGMSALKAGVKEIQFVDQGDFSVEVNEALNLNGFNLQGTYHRADVFKFLDSIIANNKKVDLILCDPPAFAKSILQKAQALEGYSKLHRKVFKCLAPQGVVAFSSCTHYVGHEEFQKNVSDAALKENRKIQLVFSGIQGFDHPVSSLASRSNYIKSYFYIVE
jgi:23S rRNA (cytosine1962-C5)-methyltransferase